MNQLCLALGESVSSGEGDSILSRRRWAVSTYWMKSAARCIARAMATRSQRIAFGNFILNGVDVNIYHCAVPIRHLNLALFKMSHRASFGVIYHCPDKSKLTDSIARSKVDYPGATVFHPYFFTSWFFHIALFVSFVALGWRAGSKGEPR